MRTGGSTTAALLSIWRRILPAISTGVNGKFPSMVAESASAAWRPLSRTAALAGAGRNGRKTAIKDADLA